MKFYIARYYRDENGILQDIDNDWAGRDPVRVETMIPYNTDTNQFGVRYYGPRILLDELFDRSKDTVSAYISDNCRMRNAVPCKIRLVSYNCAPVPDREWFIETSLEPAIKGLNRKYGLLSALRIQRIIVNNLATIVFWEDGTKTVVKISDADMEDGKFDIYAGVSYAIAKKLFGSNSAFKREVDRKMENKTPVHVSKYFSQEQLTEMAEISTKLLKHFIGEKKS